MDELTSRAEQSPQDIAAHDAQSGETISYLRLHERSARLGAAMVKEGLRPGDSIALLIGHSLLDHEIRWAARRVGLACITVAPETPRMQELLEHCKAKILFASSKYRLQVEALPKGLAKQMDVIYVDGSAAREIVDGYEWTVSYGEVDDCLAVIANAGGHPMQPHQDGRPAGPLAGLKIVEVAGLGPLTFTGMLFADMGADVVRIVRPGHDDLEKGATLRGRRKLALDLRADEGREALIALLGAADVLLEGFRPGVMERLQLGPAQVMPINPRLVYGRMTGWGQTGPRSAEAGHDINYIAVSGALHAIGGSEPVVPLNLVGDYGAGALYLAMGTLAAVLHARDGGTGQVVDCAICDGTVSLLSLMHGLRHVGRWKDERRSNTIDGAAPFYRTYRCKDGKAVSVGAIEPQFYKLLLERLHLQNATLFARQHDRSLWGQQTTALEHLFLTRPRDEWTAIFVDCDACVAPVNSLEESLNDEHLLARQAFTDLAGELQPSPAPRFSASPSQVRPTAFATNVEEILAAWRSTEET